MKRKKKNKKSILRLQILPGPVGMGIVVLLVIGVYSFIQGARYLLQETDLFVVRKIEITGNRFLNREDILSRLNLKLNQPFNKINLDGLAQKILENKYVRAVSVTRNLPGTLIIDIQERQPILYLIDKNIYMVDDSGIILKKLPAMPMNNIPVVTGLKGLILVRKNFTSGYMY